MEVCKGRYLLCVGAFSMALFFTPCFAFAATIYSNSSTGNDTTGDGSLLSPYKTFHKAFSEAVSGDTINLTGTFTWTDADETGDSSTSGYTLNKNITITGQSADTTTVRAHSASSTADRRVFTVPVANTITIEKISIQNGNLSGDGAGLLINGEMTMDKVDIYNNRSSNGSGGGAQVNGSLIIKNSTVRNNTAHYKGGGLNRGYYAGDLSSVPGASDTLDIIACTIVSNKVTQTVAYLEGGGVFFRRGSGSITNSTISLNQVINGGASRSTHGIGTDDASTVVQLKNNIIAGNILSTNGGDIGHRTAGQGTYTDNGGNVIGRPGSYSNGFSASATTWIDSTVYNSAIDGTYVLQDGIGSTSGTLDLSTTLASNSTVNGTLTLALTDANSIAIDAGATGSNGSVSVASYDQRSAPFVSNPDAGAYEYGGTPGDDAESDENSGGGSVKFLETPPKPSVSVGDVTRDSALIYGSLSAPRTIIDSVGFYYWLEGEGKEEVEYNYAPTSFRYNLQNLECGSDYKFQGFARNSVSTTYTDEIDFTTNACVKIARKSDEEQTNTEANDDTSLLEQLRKQVNQLLSLWALIGQSEGINDSSALANDAVSLPSSNLNWPSIDLEEGDSGEEVKVLQQLLIAASSGPSAEELKRVGVSGFFGTYTKNALGEFQLSRGISPHAGYYGHITRNYLEI